MLVSKVKFLLWEHLTNVNVIFVDGYTMRRKKYHVYKSRQKMKIYQWINNTRVVKKTLISNYQWNLRINFWSLICILWIG